MRRRSHGASFVHDLVCDNQTEQENVMQIKPILPLRKLVGETGILPVRDRSGFRGEVGVTVLSVEPTTETDDIEWAINTSYFTVRLDKGVLIDGKTIGVFLGSAFSSLSGVHGLYSEPSGWDDQPLPSACNS
jgi:hypothetical protein